MNTPAPRERNDAHFHIRAPRSMVDAVTEAAIAFDMKSAEFLRWCIEEGLKRAGGGKG